MLRVASLGHQLARTNAHAHAHTHTHQAHDVGYRYVWLFLVVCTILGTLLLGPKIMKELAPVQTASTTIGYQVQAHEHACTRTCCRTHLSRLTLVLTHFCSYPHVHARSRSRLDPSTYFHFQAVELKTTKMAV